MIFTESTPWPIQSLLFSCQQSWKKIRWRGFILYYSVRLVVVVFSLDSSDIVKDVLKVLGRGFSGTRAKDFRDVSLVYDDP